MKFVKVCILLLLILTVISRKKLKRTHGFEISTEWHPNWPLFGQSIELQKIGGASSTMQNYQLEISDMVKGEPAITFDFLELPPDLFQEALFKAKFNYTRIAYYLPLHLIYEDLLYEEKYYYHSTFGTSYFKFTFVTSTGEYILKVNIPQHKMRDVVPEKEANAIALKLSRSIKYYRENAFLFKEDLNDYVKFLKEYNTLAKKIKSYKGQRQEIADRVTYSKNQFNECIQKQLINKQLTCHVQYRKNKDLKELLDDFDQAIPEFEKKLANMESDESRTQSKNRGRLIAIRSEKEMEENCIYKYHNEALRTLNFERLTDCLKYTASKQFIVLDKFDI